MSAAQVAQTVAVASGAVSGGRDAALDELDGDNLSHPSSSDQFDSIEQPDSGWMGENDAFDIQNTMQNDYFEEVSPPPKTPPVEWDDHWEEIDTDIPAVEYVTEVFMTVLTLEHERTTDTGADEMVSAVVWTGPNWSAPDSWSGARSDKFELMVLPRAVGAKASEDKQKGQDLLKKNLANKIFGYFASCEGKVCTTTLKNQNFKFWIKMG